LARHGKILVLVVVVVASSGCSRLGYYGHLGAGALSLAVQGRSVTSLIAAAKTPPELRKRLIFARDLRDFAAAELGLPVAGKYLEYVDLERPYVAWTVVATPEFDLEPVTWCFPIAGCVAYRGFFSRAKAERFATKLREQGMDVSVGGVRAFSSLGWLGDPLLNTFLFSEDRSLAALLFHELAHGITYVKDDSAFNESFAAAVERAGVGRWLARAEVEGAEGCSESYQRFLARSDRAYTLIEHARVRLERLYASAGPSMSAGKAELFDQLEVELEALSGIDDSSFEAWVGRDLNNADLAGLALYRRWLDSLQELLELVESDLERFYSSARCLAELDFEERSRRLEARDWSDCILARSVRPI
jgi:predicted aminopeptidase